MAEMQYIPRAPRNLLVPAQDVHRMHTNTPLVCRALDRNNKPNCAGTASGVRLGLFVAPAVLGAQQDTTIVEENVCEGELCAKVEGVRASAPIAVYPDAALNSGSAFPAAPRTR